MRRLRRRFRVYTHRRSSLQSHFRETPKQQRRFPKVRGRPSRSVINGDGIGKTKANLRVGAGRPARSPRASNTRPPRRNRGRSAAKRTTVVSRHHAADDRRGAPCQPRTHENRTTYGTQIRRDCPDFHPPRATHRAASTVGSGRETEAVGNVERRFKKDSRVQK